MNSFSGIRHRLLASLLILGSISSAAAQATTDTLASLLRSGNNEAALAVAKRSRLMASPEHLIGQADVFLAFDLKHEAGEAVEAAMAKLKASDGTDGATYALALLRSAEIRYRSGQLDESIDVTWQSLLAYRDAKGKRSKEFLQAALFFGDLYFEKGNYILAERINEQTLEAISATQGKNSLLYSSALLRKARLLEIEGELASAEYYYTVAAEKVLGLAEQPSVEYAEVLMNQAALYDKQGSFTAAEALYRQALNILEKKNQSGSALYAFTLRGMARVNIQLNNFQEAREKLIRSMNLLAKVYSEEHPQYAITSVDLASIFIQSGHYAVAGRLIQHSLSTLEKILGKRHPAYARALALDGLLHARIGSLDSAASRYQRSLDTLRKYMGERNKDYADVQSATADLYYQRADYENAIALHQLTFDLRSELFDELHPANGQSLNRLALACWASGKHGAAEAYFRRTTDNFTRQYQRYFTFLSEKEKTYFYGSIGTYFEIFNNFSIDSRKRNPSILSTMYNNLLTTKAVLFHSTQAMRKTILGSQDQVLIEKYLRWLHLKELLSKVYKLSEDEIADTGINRDSLENTANFLEKELSLRSQLLDRKKEVAVDATTWQQIREALQADEAAIEIVRFRGFEPDSGGTFNDQVYYAALIITQKTQSNPSIVLMGNGKELESRSLNYYRNAIRLTIEDLNSYSTFWKPIATHADLRGIKKVFLSPDGVYNQININTLINPETKRFAIDELLIHTVSNTREVLAIKSQPGGLSSNRKGKTLLIGYPDYYYRQGDATSVENGNPPTLPSETRALSRNMFAEGISELPGTKTEIEAIAELFRSAGMAVDSYLGINAFEKTFKERNLFFDPPAVIHIATHGFFSAKPPSLERSMSTDFREVQFDESESSPLLRSGILLTSAAHAYKYETLVKEVNAVLRQERYEDGVLSAYEAMNLNLTGTELVVLSACETGLGDVKNGEGIYGLQRSLQTAGAKSVVMSLWKVDDAATVRFMSAFYALWFRLGDKRAAFRDAQLQIRGEFAHPYYWGAFVMIGD